LIRTSANNAAAARRRIIALACYLGAVIALSVSSLWLVNDLMVRSEEIAGAQAQFEQLSSHFRVALQQSTGTGTRMPFLDGRTVTIAGAGLQERLDVAVANAGGALVSSQVDLDGPEAKNGFVGLTASVEIGQPELQSLLYDLEAGMPYLFVDKLSIQSPEQFGEPQTGRMRMTLSVTGQWRGSP
jgi:general secretion pathway protein M